jgi:hypothetical protein
LLGLAGFPTDSNLFIRQQSVHEEALCANGIKVGQEIEKFSHPKPTQMLYVDQMLSRCLTSRAQYVMQGAARRKLVTPADGVVETPSRIRFLISSELCVNCILGSVGLFCDKPLLVAVPQRTNGLIWQDNGDMLA